MKSDSWWRGAVPLPGAVDNRRPGGRSLVGRNQGNPLCPFTTDSRMPRPGEGRQAGMGRPGGIGEGDFTNNAR